MQLLIIIGFGLLLSSVVMVAGAFIYLNISERASAKSVEAAIEYQQEPEPSLTVSARYITDNSAVKPFSYSFILN